MAAIFQLRRDSGSVSLVDGELYINKGPNSLQYAVGDGTEITLAKLNELNTGSLYLKGGISASGDITASNAYFSGDVAISGNLFLGNNSSDNISALGVFTTDLNAGTTNTYNIGSTGSVWKNVYANSVSASSFTGSLFGMGDPTSFSTSVDLRLDRVEASSSLYDNAMSGSNRLYVSPSGSDSYDGKDPSTPFRTIKAAVESLGSAVYTNTKRHTIFVGSGEYTEQNPIALPPGVAIVGDTLRTVRLTAANPTKDYFHCHDGNYFYGLRFLNLQNPSFCFSYPCSTANATISGGSISTISVVHSMTGYTDGNNQDLGIIIEGPDVSGSIATATANVVGGVITQINVVSGGTNYSATEKPHISIPAPLSQRPIIGTSPYIQNCSSITGPFTTDGVLLSLIPGNANYAELPYNINDVRNQSGSVIGSGVIDEQGAGGGIRIDGNLVHPSSPLESFVADAFTQVNQGGPGHLVINKGYAQFVSCFTTFCTYGFKTANGGFANVSNSVIDFGKYGLVSKTYFPTSYNTATSSVNLSSYLASIQLDENGAGYTGSFAGVTIYGGGASVQAIATASVDANGSIREIIITNSGSGYTSKPTVEIDPATGPGAINATSLFDKGEISNIGQIPVKVTSISRGIDISSNMVLNGQNYLVVDVSGSGEDRVVSILNTEFHPAPASITSGSILNFHQLSNISTGNIVMEYVGSGITYNALPKFGGVPLRTREINEFAPGRVFYTSVDNIGNLKIGDYFSVNQLTGEVSITSDSFNLTGLNAIGPFRRNGFDAGVILQEVSNNTNLLNSVGLYGEDTVPTQFAVKGYVDIRDAKLNKLEISSASVNSFTASANGRLNNLETTSGSNNSRLNNLETKSASVDISLTELNSYTSSLKTAITASGTNLTINGNLTVKGTTTQIDSTTLNIGDNIIELNYGGSQTISGIYTKDATGTLSSGSLLWNSTTDRWIAGVSGSESTILLAGGDGVLSGSTDFSAFSTSVDSRLDNLETSTGSLNQFSSSTLIRLGLLETSTGSLNTATASLYTSASLMTASISSLTTSVVALQSFSGNVNNRFDRVQTYTTSVDSRFTTLGNYTASVNQTITSLNSFTESTNTRLNNLESTSASISSSVGQLNSVTTSLHLYTSSTNIRLDNIELTTSSLNSSILQINVVTASFNIWTGSTFNTFSQSVDDRLDDVEYLTGLLGGGLEASLLQINAATASLQSFTSSANSRLNNIENKTGSYATTGSNTFNGTQTINGGITTGFSAPSVDGYSLASMFVFKRSGGDGGANIRVGQGAAGYGIFGQDNNGDIVLGTVAGSQGDKPIRIYTNSANEGLTLTNQRVLINSSGVSVTGNVTGTSIIGQILANNGVVSGSSQITSILPAGVVSGSSQITLSSTTGYGTVINQNLLTTSDVTHNNLTLSGNLIVNGTTTTVNSTTLQLGDNIIELNGNGSANGGLLIKDPTGASTISGSLLWDSTGDFWKAGAAGSELKLLRIGGDGVVSGSSQVTGIGNAQLTNSSITIGSTAISLGSSATTIAGLTSVTSTGFTGALTGNASTATTLATARNINGVSFNGSTDITVTAAAGTLSGATLASGVTASSLTSVGTLTALTVTGAITANGGIAVTGAITATGNISAYVSSDRRLKNNIVPIENALTKLNKIGGYSFDWTDDYIEKESNGKGEDGYFFRKHDIGVIAQELQEILPEAVAEKTDGYLGVRYEKIIPLLIQSIKELQLEIKELKNSK
jgi:uncharacterized coiled-coil protein SlyX